MRQMSHWFLFAWLVVGQTVLYMHEADFAGHADHEDCSTCLLAHASDNAVSVDVQAAGMEPPTRYPAPNPRSDKLCLRAERPQARAPPLFSHHV